MCCDVFLWILTIVGMAHVGLSNNRLNSFSGKQCGTLFSGANYTGGTFILKDFDRSPNLKKDYRSSLAGWLNTSSVRVQRGCRLTLCSDTYFLGACRTITSNVSVLPNLDKTSGILSTNCTCIKKCRCKDVKIGKDEFGRAYLGEGCSVCNAEYIPFRNEFGSIPFEQRSSITAFVLREKLNLTVYPGEGLKGQGIYIVGPVAQNFKGTISSYKIHENEQDAIFDNRTFIHGRSLLQDTNSHTFDLSIPNEELHRLLFANNSVFNNTVIQEALESFENDRSSKNAYVVLFGTAIPRWFGFPQCLDSGAENIAICRIPLRLSQLGVSNVELRVITVPIGMDEIEHDYRMMATLDEYLSAHEELKNGLPNAVIIRHWLYETDYREEKSFFQRNLQAVNTLRHRLLDEKYSNIVFLLDKMNWLVEERDQKAETAEFESVINNQSQFPPPTVVVQRLWGRERHVNGFEKLENEDFWPKNLEKSLNILCGATGDPLGMTAFNAYFEEKEIPHYSLNSTSIDMLPLEHQKVTKYREMAAAALAHPEDWKSMHIIMYFGPRETMDFRDPLPERTCATLFSAANYQGDSLVIADVDQSINLKKEYRASIQGLQHTGSFKVEEGCTMNLCSKSCFFGTCHSFTSSEPNLQPPISSANSVNCTCQRDCRCEDIFIPKHEIGRAYLKGGCNTCNTRYIRLWEMGDFPQEEKDSVESFVLRKGCTLTIYTEEWLLGESTVIKGPILHEFNGTVESYKSSCDAAQFTPREQVLNRTDHPFVELPDTLEELTEFLSGNLSTHPGLLAAMKSRNRGRSFRRVYILIIGTNQPKLAGFPQCEDASPTFIGVCLFMLQLHQVGLENAEVHIITIPIGVLENTTSENDHKLMASLDDYISTNEDLTNSTLNAVIVYHRARFKYFTYVGTRLIRKLEVLHALRGLVVDESYSNVIFLFDNVKWLPSSEEKFHEARIAKIEATIALEWAFPDPTVIVLRSDTRFNSYYENGLRRMGNKQFWPHSLQVNLENVCEKGGDPLGKLMIHEIFRFYDAETQQLNLTALKIIAGNNSKVRQYQENAVGALAQQTTWRQFKKLKRELKLEKRSDNHSTGLGKKLFGNLPDDLKRLKASLLAETNSMKAKMSLKLQAKGYKRHRHSRHDDCHKTSKCNEEPEQNDTLPVTTENILNAEVKEKYGSKLVDLEVVRKDLHEQLEHRSNQLSGELDDKRKDLTVVLDDLAQELQDKYKELESKMEHEDTDFKAAVGNKNKDLKDELEKQKKEFHVEHDEMQKSALSEIESREKNLKIELEDKKQALKTEINHRKSEFDTKLYEMYQTLKRELGDKNGDSADELEEKYKDLKDRFESKSEELKGKLEDETRKKRETKKNLNDELDNEYQMLKAELDKVNSELDHELDVKTAQVSSDIDNKTKLSIAKLFDKFNHSKTEIDNKNPNLTAILNDKKEELRAQLSEKWKELSLKLEDEQGNLKFKPDDKPEGVEAKLGEKYKELKAQLEAKYNDIKTQLEDKEKVLETEIDKIKNNKNELATQLNNFKTQLDNGFNDFKTDLGSIYETGEAELGAMLGILKGLFGEMNSELSTTTKNWVAERLDKMEAVELNDAQKNLTEEMDTLTSDFLREMEEKFKSKTTEQAGKGNLTLKSNDTVKCSDNQTTTDDKETADEPTGEESKDQEKPPPVLTEELTGEESKDLNGPPLPNLPEEVADGSINIYGRSLLGDTWAGQNGENSMKAKIPIRKITEKVITKKSTAEKHFEKIGSPFPMKGRSLTPKLKPTTKNPTMKKTESESIEGEHVLPVVAMKGKFLKAKFERITEKTTTKPQPVTKKFFEIDSDSIEQHGVSLAMKGKTLKAKLEPTTKKPTTEKPTTKKPTTEKPTTKKPTTEKPTTKKPTTEKPTTKKPTIEKPTTKKPTTEKPTTKKMFVIDSNSFEKEPNLPLVMKGKSNTAKLEKTKNKPTAKRPRTKRPTSKKPTTKKVFAIDSVSNEDENVLRAAREEAVKAIIENRVKQSHKN